MDDAGPATYPFSRSFVVQFRDGAGPGTRRFAGRVEHLRSGRRAHFDTRKEFFAFLESALFGTDDVTPAGGADETSSSDEGS